MTRVRAPGSSANLGPGFDVLGVALSRHVWCSDQPHGEECGPGHISRVAYESAGGTGRLWFGFDLPPGRGLGFSAAARSAGAVLAKLQLGHDIEVAQELAYPIVAEMEGHGDNAAPSVFGGLHLIAGELRHRVEASLPGQLLCWIPESETPTDESRLELPTEVSRTDAVFNLGRIALLMAALYEDRSDLLREATRDRLHQPRRLDRCRPSREAMQSALDNGATAAWLSGSGPTVAILADGAAIDRVMAGLPADGRVLRLDVDLAGAMIVEA